MYHWMRTHTRQARRGRCFVRCRPSPLPHHYSCSAHCPSVATNINCCPLHTHATSPFKAWKTSIMIKKHRVPVFDPGSKDLRKLPLGKLDGQWSQHSPKSILTSTIASTFEKFELPRVRRRVDVYESNHFEEKSTHALLAGPAITDDVKHKSYLARLYISRLGVASDIQRLLSSKSSNSRTLYIGAMPDI